MKISNYLLPAAFILLLILPSINGKMKIWEYEKKDENRQFRDSLSIDVKRLDYFPKEAESYLSDNFSFRTPLLDLYHKIKFSYFKVSPHPNKTIVGNDNWFFMAKEEKEIFEGNKDFSNAELNEFIYEWKSRKRYLDSMNIKTYWVIAPMKHYVYSEKLPFSIYTSKKRRVDQLKEYFNEDLPDLIIDPLPVLLENKKERKLFYKLDNHWNYHSGYLTAKMLLGRIKEDFPNIEIPEVPVCEWRDSTLQSGIHYNVIGVKELSEVRQFPLISNAKSLEVEKYGFESIEGFAYPWEYERRYKNTTLKSGLKVLFIRDSFGEQVMPFLSEVFEESVFIFDAWRYQLNEAIIQTVKPDVVVFIGLETHIDNVIKDY